MIFVGKGHKNRASFSLFPSNGRSQWKLHFILFFVRFPVKMKVNGRRGVFRQHTFEGENVRLPNRLDALERLEQRLSAHLADARNPVERRAGRGPRMALVVERDGKAVRLLLDLTDQGEDVRRGVQWRSSLTMPKIGTCTCICAHTRSATPACVMPPSMSMTSGRGLNFSSPSR